MKTYWDVGHTHHCSTTVCFYLSFLHAVIWGLWTGSACLLSSECFCVNLEKEVTAGGSANGDTSQWGSLPLEYESLHISRVFILTLIHSYAIASNTILRIRLFFPLCLANPPSPSPLPKPFISLSSTLLSSHHSWSVFFLEFPSTVELKAASLSLSVLFVFFFYIFSPQLPEQSV